MRRVFEKFAAIGSAVLLAPDIVEAIMDGRQPAELGMHVLRQGFAMEWVEQRATQGA